MRIHPLYAALLTSITLFVSGCTHHIEVSAKEPITINLNVKIEHEIKVKVDKELDNLFSENDELF